MRIESTKHNESCSTPDTATPRDSVVLPTIERLCAVTKTLFGQIVEKLAENQRANISEELLLAQCAASALRQLVSFCSPPGAQMQPSALKAGVVELARRFGYSPLEARETYFRATDRAKGQQPKYRFVTAAILEAQEKAKRDGRPLTWTRLAQMFCPCGKLGHYRGCAENLRRNAKYFRKLLRDIGEFCGYFDRR